MRWCDFAVAMLGTPFNVAVVKIRTALADLGEPCGGNKDARAAQFTLDASNGGRGDTPEARY